MWSYVNERVVYNIRMEEEHVTISAEKEFLIYRLDVAIFIFSLYLD